VLVCARVDVRVRACTRVTIAQCMDTCILHRQKAKTKNTSFISMTLFSMLRIFSSIANDMPPPLCVRACASDLGAYTIMSTLDTLQQMANDTHLLHKRHDSLGVDYPTPTLLFFMVVHIC
jgi:hypothetical protein